MSLRPIELQAIWNVIAVPKASRFNSYPLDPPFDDVRLALDEGGRRHLLVERKPDEVISAGKGLIAETSSSLVFDGVLKAYLDIGLQEPALSQEFDALICDVLDDGVSSGPRAQAVHIALTRWRSLLRLAASRIMSPERRLGLFGELVVLDNLRAVSATPWRYWTGPLGKAHDFELGEVCLEVKTMGVGSREIRIHGLDQMLPDSSELLLLVHVVSEDPGGRTLADVASDLKREFGAPEFDALVARAGWSDLLDPGPPMVIEETIAVPIREGVPRLVPSDVPAGVFAVDYDLELETLRTHAMEEDFVTRVGLCTGGMW